MTRLIFGPRTRRPASHCRNSAFTLFAILGVTLAAGAGAPAFADTPAPSTVAATALPADVQKINDQIDDLNILAGLGPLKLTADQIDKLLPTIKAISQEGEAKKKKDYDIVRGLAADVAKVRADMIAGKPLDTDLATKLEKINADLGSRYASAHQDAIQRVADAMKDALTPEQNDKIQDNYVRQNKGRITVPSNLRNSPEKTKTYIRTQAMQWFAERFLLTERTIPLLEALKSASAATPETAAAPPAAPVAGSPPPAAESK